MVKKAIPSGVILNRKKQKRRFMPMLSFSAIIDHLFELARFLEEKVFMRFPAKLVGCSLAVIVSVICVSLILYPSGNENGKKSSFSLASVSSRLKRQVSDIYNVDASLLENNSLSVISTLKSAAGLISGSSSPKIIDKHSAAAGIVSVSTSGKPAAFSGRLHANNYPSYNLVSRKLIQIIRKKGRSGIDPVALSQKIITESKLQDFDPLFVAAVIKSESAFDRLAVSSAGARGLMQIMPSTGTFIAGLEGFESVMKQRLTDPDYNVKLGIAYLKYLEQMYKGNRMLILTAYNWGPGRVVDAIDGRRRIPAEVMSYALRILRDHQEWVNELMFAA